ncbi:MAG: hypothetical protein RJA16_1131, partial [Planctomycetota bacterium]
MAAAAIALTAASAAPAGVDRDPIIPADILLRLAPGSSLDSVVEALSPLAPGLEAVEQIPNRPIHLLRYEA